MKLFTRRFILAILLVAAPCWAQLSKAWYTTANRVMDDVSTAKNISASELFALKGYLLGTVSGTNGAEGARPSSANWTLTFSSDGTTASAADNLGGAVFNAAKWVRAAAASPHSYFVVQSPAGATDGPWFLLFSMGTAADSNWVVSISKAAFAGGTASADPTSAVQSTFASTQMVTSTTAAGKTHFITDANGNFWFLASRNGTGYVATMVMFQALVEARSSGDSTRSILVTDFLDSGRGVPRMDSTSVTWRGLAYDGNTAISSGTGVLANLQLAGSALSSLLTATNGIDGKVDGFPVHYVADQTTSFKAVRGRIPDLWSVGAQIAVGSGSPTTATPTRVVLGTNIIPMSVAPSL